MIGYLDCFSGISGDMFLGAMVDAGLDPDHLRDDLARLRLGGYSLQVSAVTRAGLGGTRVEVVLEDRPSVHRRLPDILNLITASRLPPAVQARARAVFEALARAEARVHRRPVEEVHFHEVGAVDAIVDVVGAAAGLERLGVRELYCSAVPVGPGEVRAAHGQLPLPAPATLELLRGRPVRPGPPGLELVTPTGAAILAALARPAPAWPDMVVERVGYGAGSRDLPAPNLLRLVLGRAAGTAATRRGHPPWLRDEVDVLETNLDDVTPQEVAYLAEQLLAAGALDAWVTPIVMKKGRPGVTLSALAPSGLAGDLAAALFREGATPGVRRHRSLRFRLPVEEVRVDAGHGEVRVKRIRGPKGFVRVWPEYEDCRAVAGRAGVPLAEVLRAAREAASVPGAEKGGHEDGG